MSSAFPTSGGSDAGLPEVTFGEYAAVLRRRIWLIVAVAALSVAVAALVASLRPELYQTSTTVFVQPLTADPLAGLSSGEDLIDPSTESELVTSDPVLTQVAGSIPGLTPAQLRENTTVETAEASQVLRIVTVDGDPERAATIADLLASAYLEQRSERAAGAVAGALGPAEERVETLQEELDDVVDDIAAIDRTTDAFENSAAAADLATLESRRTTLQAQLGAASLALAEIASVQLTPGDVLTPASVPERPVGLSLTLILLLAAVIGGLIGVVLAFVRNRTDDRVHSPAEVERILDAPVLAGLPKPRLLPLRADRAASERDDAIRRLSVALRSAAATDPTTFTLAVTAVDDLPGRPELTLEIAQTLALDGTQVLVVDADASTPSVTTLLGCDEREPGLLDAVVDPRQADGFVVVPPTGGTTLLPYGDRDADRTGRPGALSLRDTFARLEVLAEFVVLHVAPLRSAAESLELQRWASGSLLVVHGGRTSAASLRQSRRELDLAGANIVGALLVQAEPLFSRRGRRAVTPTAAASPDDEPSASSGGHDAVAAGSSGSPRS